MTRLRALLDSPSGDWPADAGRTILTTLSAPTAELPERVLAACLAGESPVVPDELALCLLGIACSDSEPEELRSVAAAALGRVLDDASTTGFDPEDEDFVSEATFERLRSALRQLHGSAEVPAVVRRAALWASVHAPEDWHAGAVRAAFKSEDEGWRTTAVACMYVVSGMDEEILEALRSEEPHLLGFALRAAGAWAVDAAWPVIVDIMRTPDIDEELLLAAIGAAPGIRPEEAQELVAPFLGFDDGPVSGAAAAARMAAAHFAECERRDAFGPSGSSPDGTLADGQAAASVSGEPTGRDAAPLSQAQDLVYEAFEERRPDRRLALARRALELSPDCADAWVLIAEEDGRTRAEALELYAKGVEAGERALGPEAFEEDVGHFWGLLETRPYMRARFGLARCLQSMGRFDEAIENYHEFISLNPGDNQGVRWILLDLLLERGLDDEARALLEQYEGGIYAGSAYAAALLAYRTEGDSEHARERLASALEANPHVPAYLTGKRRIPRQLPDYMGIGDEKEAICCAASQKLAWRNTAGALPWLAERSGRKKRRRR